MRSTFKKKNQKRNFITNGSKNMILGNHDFSRLGVCVFFGVGGSIRLVKLVCLLLARASQVPYTAQNIIKTFKNPKMDRKRK